MHRDAALPTFRLQPGVSLAQVQPQAQNAVTLVAERQLRHDELSVVTLRRFGRDHLLAVESARAQSPLRVRGVISRAQTERAPV